MGQWIGWQPKGFPVQPTTEAPRVPSSTPVDGARSVSGRLAGHTLQAVPTTPLPWPVSPSDILPSIPGSVLRGGRYRLRDLWQRQDWSQGVFEATWIAQDARQGAAPVTICELVLPNMDSPSIQAALQHATMTLIAIGGHRRIPSLEDAFSEQGRSFFVFQTYEGESLLTRMQASGGAVAEQHVIDCCLQMTEVLELLQQHFPPVVHGRIRPEHIVLTGNSWQCVLTTFSIVLAMQAAQFIAGIEKARLSPYMAPELARGVVDPRADLYALMATSYHAVTGNVPTRIGGTVPPARQVNSSVSPQFEAILTKGLQSVAEQRYQRVSELRHDLLAIRAASRTSADLAPGFPIQLAIAQVQGSEDAHSSLLPTPEALPPISTGNDTRVAALWMSLVLLGMILLVVMSRLSPPS